MILFEDRENYQKQFCFLYLNYRQHCFPVRNMEMHMCLCTHSTLLVLFGVCCELKLFHNHILGLYKSGLQAHQSFFHSCHMSTAGSQQLVVPVPTGTTTGIPAGSSMPALIP